MGELCIHGVSGRRLGSQTGGWPADGTFEGEGGQEGGKLCGSAGG